MDNVKTIKIKSVENLMTAVRDLPSGRRLFRGQSVDEPLLPRYAREAKRRKIENVVDVERRLLDTFARLAIPYIGIVRPRDDFEWLAVAQHHGIPTRLLDWTGNPLFALWFAVREIPSGMNGTFWALNVIDGHLLPLEVQHVYKLKRTYLFRPSHITQRIVAQDGWFTIHWYIEKDDKFVPLDNQPRFKRYLRKYLIPAECFPRIKSELQQLGIKDGVLFPELQTLCAELVAHIFPEP